MSFQKLRFTTLPEPDMISRSTSFLNHLMQRRTIRGFSDKSIPLEIIKNAIKAASSAPSGANKQPWHFVIVQDPGVKKEIRTAAEKEERRLANRARMGAAFRNRFGIGPPPLRTI